MIGYLHKEMVRLLRKFMGKFVSSKVILSSEDITKVDIGVENQLPDGILAVGMGTRAYLAEHDINPEIVKSFFRHVREFYAEVTAKMIVKFPFKDELLVKFALVNPELRKDISAETACSLAKRFCDFSDAELEQLGDQTADFQLTLDDDLPTFSQNEDRFDAFWTEMKTIKIVNSCNQRFNLLSNLALNILTLPHSNADSERSFSILRKIDTDSRGNLSHNTIVSLMNCKFNIECECFKYIPPKSVLSKAKSACSSYMQNLQSVSEEVNREYNVYVTNHCIYIEKHVI